MPENQNNHSFSLQKSNGQKSNGQKSSGFPRIRLRRNRAEEWSRNLIRENHLHSHDLIWPVFVQEGQKKRTKIRSMPGVFRLSIDYLVQEVKRAESLGIPAVALFPVINKKLKSSKATEAFNARNLMCRAIKAVKKATQNIGIICDAALDPYTSHGHDGVVRDGKIVNDETIDLLAKYALVLAKAGCDIVAPSDMMDGRVGVIRDFLDKHNFQDIKILSYAAKYASNFYGPFREAVGSSESLGKSDKRTYQMDIANSDEALLEVALDIAEGADMVMVKPGMPYLDIVRRLKDNFHIPVFAYQVSAEYSMIKAAAQKGWINEMAAMYESIVCFKRAGATGIFTYAALDIAKLLNNTHNTLLKKP